MYISLIQQRRSEADSATDGGVFYGSARALAKIAISLALWRLRPAEVPLPPEPPAALSGLGRVWVRVGAWDWGVGAEW